MDQHHARGCLVDILAAVTARTDKSLVNVRFAHTERGHALGELAFLFRADGKRAHGSSVTGVRWKGNGGIQGAASIESGKTLAASVRVSSMPRCKSYRTTFGWKMDGAGCGA